MADLFAFVKRDNFESFVEYIQPSHGYRALSFTREIFADSKT